MTTRPTGRLHWRIHGTTSEHVLEVMPSLVGKVRLMVDGKTVATVAKPSRSKPWIERRIELEGSELTIVLSLDALDLRTDVFKDEASLIDGRTLAAARRSAPTAVTGFEAWTLPPVSGVAQSRLAPPWLVVVAVVAIASLIIAGLVGIPPSLRPAVVAYIVGVNAIFLLRTWAIVVARTRRTLLARSDLGEQAKFVWFLVAAAASGLILAAVPVALVVVIDSLARGG
jgi:hypothetical protein